MSNTKRWPKLTDGVIYTDANGVDRAAWVVAVGGHEHPLVNLVYPMLETTDLWGSINDVPPGDCVPNTWRWPDAVPTT